MDDQDLFPVVLVVDDDRLQVALITSFLQKAGFRVVSAASAIIALKALEAAGEASNEISLLVTDLDMPGMSGLTFATEMRKKHPALKVLYVTARASGLFQQGHQLQDNEAFLEKPVSQHALREAVNLLIRSS
jgi:two-component system cell cycle sensor histidine kinase/response regulator CckA